VAYVWIAFGSAIGGVLRYCLSGVIGQRLGETFPWGTIAVNVSGCFLIGFIDTLTGVDGRAVVNPHAREFIMLGLLGGYTTFSSFGLQTLNLARDGEWLYASGNVLVSVALCLVAVWLGHLCAGILNH
jgi:CrcB protein